MSIWLVLAFMMGSMVAGIFMGRHWDYFTAEE